MRVTNIKIPDGNKNSSFHFRQIRERILLIQKIKRSAVIENLAASSSWISDGEAAWDNFICLAKELHSERYDCYFSVDNQRINQLIYDMTKQAQKIQMVGGIPSSLLCSGVGGKVADFNSLGEFKGDRERYVKELLHHLMWGYGSDRFFILNSVPPTTYAMKTAALTLRILLEKTWYSHDSEYAEEIRNIFFWMEDSNRNSQTIQEVREQAVLLIENKYKHGWRGYIRSTGIIDAFKLEEDNSLRARIAKVLAKASPKSILEEWYIKESAFRPLDRLFTDRNLEVKHALLSGIEQLCLAQERKGQYYKDFAEVPELNVSERIRCLSSTIRVLEQLFQYSHLTNNVVMLNSSGNIISCLLSDEAIDYIQSRGQQGQYDEFKNLIERFLNLDLVNLINIAIQTALHDTSQERFKVIDAVYLLAERVISSRLKILKEPLVYFPALRKKVMQMTLQYQPDYITDKLKLIVDNIDIAIESYLNSQNILNYNVEEFNNVVSGLLDVLENSRRDSTRFAVLNVFGSFMEKGIALKTSERVPIEKIVSVENLERLKKLLMHIVHHGNLTKPLFLAPKPDSLRGKALLLYRQFPKLESYKDYFGMAALKTKVSTYLVEMIVLGSSAKWMLLSGIRGTGKSMFAKVLTNEFAIPLRSIEGSEIKRSVDSGILIKNEKGEFVSTEKYLDDIAKSTPCVILVDEVDKVTPASAQNSAFLSFLEKLKTLNVMVIATTNCPSQEEIDGMSIDKDGNSREIDDVLTKYVHKRCLKHFEISYYFQDDTVGSSFTSEYLIYLAKLKQINESLNIKLISLFGKGLTPLDLKEAIDEILISSNRSRLQIMLLTRLGKMQMDRYKILSRAKILEIFFNKLNYEDQVRLRGQIDYRKFAFLTLDVPNAELEPMVLDWMKKLDEDRMFNLFSECLKCDANVIEALKKL